MNAGASVADLKLRIEAAGTVQGNVAELDSIIDADRAFQMEIASEIKRLSDRARVSAASAAAARAKRDGNTKLIYDLRASLEAAMAAH